MTDKNKGAADRALDPDAHWIKILEGERDDHNEEIEVLEKEDAEVISKFDGNVVVVERDYGDWLEIPSLGFEVMLSAVVDMDCELDVDWTPRDGGYRHLHGVVLHGFKSSPDRTAINFHLLTGRVVSLKVPVELGEIIYLMVRELWRGKVRS